MQAHQQPAIWEERPTERQATRSRALGPEGTARRGLAIAGIAQPNRDRGLVAHVVGALGRAIIAGQVAPGQTLPTEPEFGRQFAVSRPAIREATRILASKGLLETRSRRGTRVSLPESWHLLGPAVLLWRSAAIRSPVSCLNYAA